MATTVVNEEMAEVLEWQQQAQPPTAEELERRKNASSKVVVSFKSKGKLDFDKIEAVITKIKAAYPDMYLNGAGIKNAGAYADGTPICVFAYKNGRGGSINGFASGTVTFMNVDKIPL